VGDDVTSSAVLDRNDGLAGEAMRLRPRLFGIAYRVLGSVVDAEDAVQETFLRWEEARANETVITAPEGWLVSVVTRLCIDQLRSARVQRERYVGEWLPEPLVAGAGPDLEESAETAESVSMAFLVLLERLSAVERAVFLLHDVFAYGYAEIASIVGKSEPACRQLAKRARASLEAGRSRFHPAVGANDRLVSGFLRASVDGDLPGLLALLTEDIALVADGGGKVPAARVPIHGAERVARALIGFVPLAPAGWWPEPATINGGPGLVVRLATGEAFAALAFDVEDGRIATIRAVGNPDKLRGIPSATPRDASR
jgi:RNA polymerase sigma-70 factor (ECF subfamily)